MPELGTIALLVGMFLAAIAGEAVFYRDTLHLQINVPNALQEQGLSEPVAEEVFSSEAARILRGQSVVPAPDIRIHSQPNLLSAVVQPLSLDSAVAALQTQFGVDRLGVIAAIMPGKGKPDPGDNLPVRPPGRDAQPLQLLLLVSQRYGDPAQVRLAQDDGDAVTLLRRGAQWAMERVAPYRVALSHFLSGTQGDPEGFPAARHSVARSLARPWHTEQASERAMLLDLHALLDAADDKLAEALATYRTIGEMPDLLAAVRADVALNHATLALALKQSGQAADLLKRGADMHAGTALPDFAINLQLLEGLIAWAESDLATAESRFRSVAAQAPMNEAGHRYLGQLLAARGDRDGSVRALDAAQAVHGANPPQEALALALFWVDPVAGGLTRRF